MDNEKNAKEKNELELANVRARKNTGLIQSQERRSVRAIRRNTMTKDFEFKKEIL